MKPEREPTPWAYVIAFVIIAVLAIAYFAILTIGIPGVIDAR